MNWVRSKVRQAALLALFALAIQLVLSFGHAHAEDFAHDATLQATSLHDTTPQSPHHHHHDGLAAHHCGVCASVMLSGTATAAAAPVLVPPPAPAIQAETAAADFALPDLAHAAFRSRAPPRS